MVCRPLRLLWVLLFLGFASCSTVSARLVEWKKREYREAARLVEHRVTAGGHDIVYLDRGSGEPMVLVHGFGGDKDNFTLLARHIPDRYRPVVLDLPGFGESARHPGDSYDVRTQAARLREFVDAVGLPRFHLAGNSMGGHIAARFTIEHSERVQSLMLINAAGVTSPHPSEFVQALQRGQNPLLVSSVEDFDRVMALTFVKPLPIPSFLKRYFAERAVANRAFNDKVFGDLGQRPDRLDGELGTLSAPTLVLWGDTDRIIDVSAAQVFAGGIHGAQLAVLKDCGHAPMLERPEETAQRYFTFLAGLSPR